MEIITAGTCRIADAAITAAAEAAGRDASITFCDGIWAGVAAVFRTAADWTEIWSTDRRD